MKIISTIIPLSSAQDNLREINVDLQISTSSLYDIAESAPTLILTQQTDKVKKIMEEYPNIMWGAPQLEYPGYNIETSYGFDLRNTIESEPIENIKTEISFVNTFGEQSKLFIKKLESLNMALRVYGPAFGIYGMGHIKEKQTASLYKSSEFCAADNMVEIYKILLLNKPCLTPFDFPYCHNVFDPNFDINKVSAINGQVNTALNNTFYDKFANIFYEINMDHLADKLLKIKEKIINDN